MTGLSHVALAVTDPDRSLAFYRDVVGIEARVRAEDYGFVLETSNGVSFTLFRGQPPPDVGEFHIGVTRPDSAAVRSERARFAASGVDEHEWNDEPGYTSVKIVDPDGYLVEVSWEDHN
jgi:catechol 2,3-dioxygenase-like lactoylglutathione lyase family enzyme